MDLDTHKMESPTSPESQYKKPLPILTVGTYNIHSCVGSDGIYSVSRVADMINHLNVDVVALQEVEVNSSWQKTRLWSSSHGDDQVSLLSELTGMKYTAFGKAVTSVSIGGIKEEHDTEKSKDGNFGIAILSKVPLEDVEVKMYKRYKNKTPRNALSAKITLNGRAVRLICTHLGCHTGAEQHQQSVELSGWMSSFDGSSAVVVCGDTNSPPWFRSMRRLLGGSEGFEGCGNRDRTFPALGWPGCFWMTCCRPVLLLDYVFYKDGNGWITCAGTEVVKDKGMLVASDHRPVKVTFVEKSGTVEVNPNNIV